MATKAKMVSVLVDPNIAAEQALDDYCSRVYRKQESVYKVPSNLSDVSRVTVMDALGLYNGEEMSV
jgi:hypothetical protein